MEAGSGYNAYQNSQVYEGMDPKRLILMLYEGALKHLRLAKEGIQENDVKKRGEHLGRAISIVSGLNASLDSEIKDESIEFLRGLYNAILTELPKVSINNDVKTLERAFSYLERLKDIWEKDVIGNGDKGKKEVSTKIPDKKEEKASPKTQSVSYGSAGGYNSALMAGGRSSFSV
jgi:flagellar protein FliS